ncbi:T6SS immunity protein Tli4 family protein [Cronobacter dublinensis subsp. beijingensis]|uniref:T6SS immunity protein Tli4 family protein n=1 Tax=Cronobacter dublinensis TaxID=413497 RepID=UPI0023DA66BA|nr:T6SS immunity protein Tli4 family protein [Cronobacter dublinensis]WEP51351.1 T6SS immunity protein Tli4 family protein [Cronobacter dublinensis]
MRVLSFSFIGVCLLFSYSTHSQGWKRECLGYYQLELPDNLDVALYPINGFINPVYQPEGNGFFITSRYATNGITFGEKYYKSTQDAVQSQFSTFYYGNYELDISTQNKEPVDFSAYKERIIDKIKFGIDVAKKKEALQLKILGTPVMDKSEFDRKHGYEIKDYPHAFVEYDYRGYTIYINGGKRLYHFWGPNAKDTGEKSQTAEKQWQQSEPEVLSLLSRFRPRNLYEVPSAQGFCLPYGFIANDSGHESRNMGVTYRLKNHPDVTIFFQDLGMKPESGKEDDLNQKDYVTWLWNWQYQWSAASKELIKPKWRSIKMDGRDGIGTFVRATYKNFPVYDDNGNEINRQNYINYGYVAYVQGNHQARNLEPDLLLYVMQDSSQAKGQPPMSKDELLKLAEHIVSTIKRR